MSSIHAAVSAYYTRKLADYGATPAGVDWNSDASQALRFTQLLKLLPEALPLDSTITLNDLGCGYGALYGVLTERQLPVAYHGYDLSPAMITAAQARFADPADGLPAPHWTVGSTLSPTDYTVASGIFNVRMSTPVADWEAFLWQTLDEMAAGSRQGFAFNLLSTESDPDKRRADLYYGDPAVFLAECRKRYAPHVRLLRDYGLYEWTLLVSHTPRPDWD